MNFYDYHTLKEYIQNLWSMKAQGVDYLKGTPLELTGTLSSPKYSLKETHVSEPFVCRISHPVHQWPLVFEYISLNNNNKTVAWQMSFNSQKKQVEIYLSFYRMPPSLCYRFSWPETSIPSKKMSDPDFNEICFRKGIGVCSIKTHLDIEWLTPEYIPVYIEPFLSKLFIDQQIMMGEVIDISLDVVVCGSGTLDIFLWGDGIVTQTQQIKNSSGKQPQKIMFCLDTRRLTSLDTKVVDLYIQTNSKVVNKRNFSIPIQLNCFYYIHCYPVDQLMWLLNDVSIPISKKIQITLKGPSASINHMQINIPESLSDYITFDVLDVVKGEINFILNKNHVKPGEQIDDFIQIHFLLESNKKITAEIPVCINFPTSHSSITLNYPAKLSNDMIDVDIQNKDTKHNCFIRSLTWKNNKFSYVHPKQSNYPDQWPLIPPEKTQTLRFRLNPKKPWIFSSRIKDEITIHSNSGISPEFSQKIDLSVRPVFWQKVKDFFHGISNH